ncbi:putative glutathione S-transferase parA [Tasmannia lanceolata]|uniref:putative glutathione S-transferase parA n=1 Tax=Tasmannia lanceolata TaxID=3420 RepID=UPI0040644063
MADEVILLDFWPSPYGIRARIALAEKGIHYEYKEENLQDKSHLLLKSNPVLKKIPVLIHNGKPVCESLVIVEYIDEVWNEKSPLMPQDPYQRAKARFWAELVDKKIYESGSRIWKKKGEAREEAKKEFLENLKLFEEELKEKSYFGGDALGIVDVFLLSFAGCWFYTYEKFGNFSIEDECPKIMSWVKRCMEKESVSKSLPEPQKIYEFVGVFKKANGME